MSMRGKDSKRVSFDPVSTQNNIQQQSPIPPTSLPVKENAREDPNVSMEYTLLSVLSRPKMFIL